MSLTLHMHPLASFCQKVLIALYENDTPFEPHLVDLGDAAASAAFKALWPMGKMPVLRDETRGITRSPNPASSSSISISIIPARTRLIPADPELALQARFGDRFYDLYVHEPMQKIVTDRLRPAGKNDPHGVEQARALMQTAYGMIEQAMAVEDLGGRRCIHHGRLRRGSGAVLREQGRAVRRDASARCGLFRPADGTTIIRARRPGGRALPQIISCGNDST